MHLGAQEKHTVFEAELVGAAMGAKLLQLKREGTLTIALDSQVEIQIMGREAMVSGQYLVNAFHRQMEGLSPG